MEPIINPWLIYLLGIIKDVKEFSIGLAIISGIGLITYIIFLSIKGGDDDDKSYYSIIHEKTLIHVRSKLKFFRWLFPILLFLTLVTPSRGTIIGMIIANNITPNNINTAISTGKSVKDEVKKDILDIINKLTEKKDEFNKK